MVLLCMFRFFPSFHWITPFVAIGANDSSYESFETIVNLNFPDNGVEYHTIEESVQDGKRIIKVGIYDHKNEKEFMKDVLTRLRLPNNQCILFQCYAGMSRSATVAISHLVDRHRKSVHETFLLAKKKRPLIFPNVGFMEALAESKQDHSFFEWFTLQDAIEKGCSVHWVEYMIQKGGDVNQITDNGSLLELACNWGRIPLIRSMLEHGANPNGTSPRTPLHVYISISKPDLELVDLFLSKGANLNARDDNGRTVLHYLYINNFLDLVSEFRVRGADHSISDQDGRIPSDYLSV